MEKKSLAKNSVFNMAYKGFTALFPLVTTTYISRVLLPEGVGRVAYANTIVSYFVFVASLGLPGYGVKAIAQNNETKEQRSRTFFELFLINLISTLICLAAYYIFVNSVPYFAERRMLFRIMGLMIVLNIFNIDWFYQGIEEYGFIAVRGFAVKIASFVLMLLFVKEAGDYLIYALILCIATAGNNLPNALRLPRYVAPVSGIRIRQHMRPVLILLASAVATEIYTMLDTVMLEYFHGEVCVGYYSNPVRIVRMTYTVVIALVAVFYPRISSYYKRGEKENCDALLARGTKILLLLSLPGAVGLALTADMIVPLLFGNAFLPSIRTLQILSVLVPVFSIAYFLGHIVLTAVGMERMILWASIGGAVINAVSNLFLIPAYRQEGAAIASVMAEFVVTGILLWHARKYFTLRIGGNFVFTMRISLFLLVVSVVLLKQTAGTAPWMAVPIILCAVIIYFGSLAILKNELIAELIKKAGCRIRNRRGG